MPHSRPASGNPSPMTSSSRTAACLVLISSTGVSPVPSTSLFKPSASRLLDDARCEQNSRYRPDNGLMLGRRRRQAPSLHPLSAALVVGSSAESFGQSGLVFLQSQHIESWYGLEKSL